MQIWWSLSKCRFRTWIQPYVGVIGVRSQLLVFRLKRGKAVTVVRCWRQQDARVKIVSTEGYMDWQAPRSWNRLALVTSLGIPVLDELQNFLSTICESKQQCWALKRIISSDEPTCDDDFPSQQLSFGLVKKVKIRDNTRKLLLGPFERRVNHRRS